jgi:hypothetical protein
VEAQTGTQRGQRSSLYSLPQERQLGSTSGSQWTLPPLNKYSHRTIWRVSAFPESVFKWRKRSYLCRGIMCIQIMCDLRIWLRWRFILWCWDYGTLMCLVGWWAKSINLVNTFVCKPNTRHICLLNVTYVLCMSLNCGDISRLSSNCERYFCFSIWICENSVCLSFFDTLYLCLLYILS